MFISTKTLSHQLIKTGRFKKVGDVGEGRGGGRASGEEGRRG